MYVCVCLRWYCLSKSHTISCLFSLNWIAFSIDILVLHVQLWSWLCCLFVVLIAKIVEYFQSNFCLYLLINLNMDGNEKCVDSVFMFILLALWLWIESIKEVTKSKHTHSSFIANRQAKYHNYWIFLLLFKIIYKTENNKKKTNIYKTDSMKNEMNQKWRRCFHRWISQPKNWLFVYSSGIDFNGKVKP